MNEKTEDMIFCKRRQKTNRYAPEVSKYIWNRYQTTPESLEPRRGFLTLYNNTRKPTTHIMKVTDTWKPGTQIKNVSSHVASSSSGWEKEGSKQCCVVMLLAHLPGPNVRGHRLNKELDLKSLFRVHVHSCTHWLRPRNLSLSPAFGLIYEGAIGQPR
jgi:hypothetical protein